MKTILIAGLCLFLIFCTSSGYEKQIIAIYTEHTITIDGVASEPPWESAEPVFLMENRLGNEISDSSVQTQVRACYNDSTLYFAFLCNDPDIWTSFSQRDEYLWEEEAVEIFIDVDNVMDTYVEIEVSPANVLFDSYIVDPENINVPETALFNLPGIKTAVNITGTLNKRDDIDEKWTAEIAVPFKDLVNDKVTQVDRNTPIKINFYRLDQNKGMQRMSYAWSPTGGRFHKPAVFGKLIFK